MTSEALYDDGRTRIDESGLRLARYYFPIGRARVVPWSEVRGYEVLPMGFNARWRLWGTHRLDSWFPLDNGRRKRERMVVLEVTEGLKPVLTPDDVDAVTELLDRHIHA